MNRNTRMLIYLVFALGLVLVMMDCARRMKNRQHQGDATPTQSTP